MIRIKSITIMMMISILLLTIDVSQGRPQPQRPQRPQRPGGLIDGFLQHGHPHLQQGNQGLGGNFLQGQNGGAGFFQPTGSATAGGAGQGGVNNGVATGTGTGVAQAGPGGFGVGLGVGVGVATPIGNLSFGQGESVAVGK